MGLSYQAIYPRVKQAITASDSSVSPSDINANSVLADPPLGFTPKGKRALDGYLEREFLEERLHISEAELDKIQTVREIAQLIKMKLILLDGKRSSGG